MQVGAYIWHFRMRFCFFSSGDDVGPTRGGASIQLCPPLPVRPTFSSKYDLKTSSPEQKKQNLMRKCQMVGSHLHSPEYFVFLCFCFFSMVQHGYQMGPLLCLFFLFFSWFCIIHIHGMQLAAHMSKSGFLLILVWAQPMRSHYIVYDVVCNHILQCTQPSSLQYVLCGTSYLIFMTNNIEYIIHTIQYPVHSNYITDSMKILYIVYRIKYRIYNIELQYKSNTTHTVYYILYTTYYI